MFQRFRWRNDLADLWIYSWTRTGKSGDPDHCANDGWGQCRKNAATVYILSSGSKTLNSYGQWKVLTLHHTGKLAQGIDEMKRCKTDIQQISCLYVSPDRQIKARVISNHQPHNTLFSKRRQSTYERTWPEIIKDSKKYFDPVDLSRWEN